MKNQQSNQQNSPYGEVLTREQMKNVKGGELNGSCSLVYQNSNGNWITETGVCKKMEVVVQTDFGQAVLNLGSYCQTQSFPFRQPLSSNGGVSKCNT
ncbi:hypothetical protein [Pedobacter sp. UC225_65]|uniref:hypothetical protein n=1 Tax=Pedobacter sp. UC225_65 TaxID=3350173 RepID=UPI00366EE8C9